MLLSTLARCRQPTELILGFFLFVSLIFQFYPPPPRALHCASFKGQNEVVKYLLEHGADISARDSEGMSAIHWAGGGGGGYIYIYIGYIHVYLIYDMM